MFNLVIYPRNCLEKHIINPNITYELIKSELAKEYIYIYKYNSKGILSINNINIMWCQYKNNL